jgi:hypothetical protein
VAVPADSTLVVADYSNLAVGEDNIRLVGIVVEAMRCRSSHLLRRPVGRYYSRPVAVVADRMVADLMVRPLGMLAALISW